MRDHLAHRIYARFDGTGLDCLCRGLLNQQLETWDQLRQGYKILGDVKTREISSNSFSAIIQHNPGRKTSTTADTRQEAIEMRPCFLCIENLPKDQKGILYKEFLILCNPAPVFYHHLTINSISHMPQRIDTHIPHLLQLTKDLGTGWMTLYNGPECGASAPGHLHFQAVPKGNTPLENELEDKKSMNHLKDISKTSIYWKEGMGRGFFILEGYDEGSLGSTSLRLFSALATALKASGEPKMNIVCFEQDKKLMLCVFPRTKHRPDAFFKDGDNRITISPGTIEMAGVIVAPMERDFIRLDRQTLETIYKEASVDKKIMENVMDYLS